MKVLILNDVGAPHGGAEIVTSTLRNGLRSRGHDVRIFASSARSESGESLADYSCFGTRSRFRTLNRVVNLSAYRRLKSCLDEFRPDVVHVRSFLSQLSPTILPLLKDIPTIYHATWNEMVCPTGLKLLPDQTVCRKPWGARCYQSGCLSLPDWGILMAQLKWATRNISVFNLIVANSASMKERLLADNIGPVEVLWNGVPECPPRPPLSDPPTLTFAGRLSPAKGADILLRAFSAILPKVPDARLIIAGTGKELSGLVRLAEALSINHSIRWLGHQQHDSLNQALAPGWAHVVPSLCEEGFGQTAAEASMRGTAVIASNSGGLAEVVKDEETGFLVPPGDSKSLELALLRVLQNRELAESLGRQGRIRMKTQMNVSCWVQAFERHYQQVVASTKTLLSPTDSVCDS